MGEGEPFPRKRYSSGGTDLPDRSVPFFMVNCVSAEGDQYGSQPDEHDAKPAFD